MLKIEKNWQRMRSPYIWGKTLDDTDTKITGEEPYMKKYFYSLKLHQCRNMAVNKCHLQFGKEKR